MPFRKFPYLKNAPNREPADCLENSLLDHASPFIVHDEIDHSYRLYPTKEHYLRDVRPHITEHLHEVIAGPRKIFLDIDAPQEKIDEIGTTRKEISDEIISTVIATFLMHYDISLDLDDIIISDSSDADKFSMHVVVNNYFTTSAEEHKSFMERFLSLVSRVDPEKKCYIDISKPFIDLNVTKQITNLRLPNCVKVNSTRVKKIITSHKPEEMFISQVSGCQQLPNKVAPKVQTPDKINYNITNLEDICAKIEPHAVGHTFSKVVNGLVIYKRTHASFCEICNMEHVNDNTLFASVTEYNIYIHCRHSAQHLAPGQRRTIQIPIKERPLVEKVIIPDTFKKIKYCNEKIPEYSFEDSSCLLIKSNMGTGKTERLEQLIANLDQDWSIIFVSMRKSFTSEILKRFRDFHVYYNSKGPLNQKRLICQYESVHRIDLTGRDKLLLVLDESESVINQIEHDNNNRSGCFTKFEWLVKNSTHLILLDALMSIRSYTLAENSGKQVTLSINKFTRVDNKTDYYYDEPTFNRAFSQAIVHAKAAPIIIVSTSKIQAEALVKVAKQKMPTLNVGMYTSETDNRADIENVNEIWDKYDLLVYTPTITAGVSFTKPHFHHMFAYFDSRSCDWMTAIQMMGRVRDLSRDCHITIKKYDISLPSTVAEVESAMRTTLSNTFTTTEANIEGIKLQDGCVPPVMLCANGRDYEYQHKNLYYWIKVLNILNRCQSIMKFEAYFRNARKKMGYKSINVDKNHDIIVNFHMLQAKREIRAERNGAVANADLTELASIRVKDRESMTKDERDICDKADILLTYKLADEKLLTPEFVKKFGKQQVKDAFYNANALCVTGSHNLIQSTKTMLGIKSKLSSGDSMKDLDADPKAIMRSIGICLLSNLVTSEVGTCGLQGKCLGDSFGLDRADLDTRYARFVKAVDEHRSFIKMNFELDISLDFAGLSQANKTKVINKVLYQTTGMKINIKKTGRGNNNICTIRLAPEFKYDTIDNIIKLQTL